MDIPDFHIEPASFEVDFDTIHHVRNQVFVVEQQIPAEVEFDELDRHCHHVIARDGERRPIGTGRLSAQGGIGRLAVLNDWRGQGVGESLLRVLIEKARKLGLASVYANAQLAALGFYQKFGFVEEGDTFIEAGIPHRTMRLALEAIQAEGRPQPKPRRPSIQALRLETIESTLAASIQLFENARRQLYLYSRDLEYSLYGQNELVEALKRFALGHKDSQVRIIVQEPGNLRGRVHPVLELAQRLTSHFSIRAPLEAEDIQNLSAFVINDSDGYLFRLLGSRYEGHWSSNLPAKNRQLREEFERVWQRSRPCTEFRALGL
ncbi:GNAT family N-acetyltransferase [Methylomonas sp. MgM2]